MKKDREFWLKNVKYSVLFCKYQYSSQLCILRIVYLSRRLHFFRWWITENGWRLKSVTVLNGLGNLLAEQYKTFKCAWKCQLVSNQVNWNNRNKYVVTNALQLFKFQLNRYFLIEFKLFMESPCKVILMDAEIVSYIF